ncbi:N-6 DNA methylase [Xanthomonas phaseoli]|uniref:N-6 DNA methylase n=1 Tax=Xanthomonas phaseoli TaxID=1985254 RepID=UPI001ADB1BD6|nr:N-6 DNA methylase [Xanthomonas phaseoli]MBO9853980.1 N-6 DNA methylase [Xanthomonas phaseoli pv. dieffenbachiae]MBO9965986.1 N-6 DNA methylase [Xanthomonas phaseoli pv. dieffenbachiae]MBO9985847.1 N-6 DNA methylase [Xanthomonas phaseoli pv. dieffenbachiae]
MSKSKGTSERRSELLLHELLAAQGWSIKRPPIGDLLLQNEYGAFPELEKRLRKASKTGGASGYPEALLVDKSSNRVLAVIEAKKYSAEIIKALAEAQNYASNFTEGGYAPLSIGLAGTSDDSFELRVSKWTGKKWDVVTYNDKPISWIPNRIDLDRVATPHGSSELRPTIPPPEVLAKRADEINRYLREAKIKDEFRPAVVAAIMLALASSKGKIRRDEDHILGDINAECNRAFLKAGKPELGKSLRVEEANAKLAAKAVEIARILEKLNVSVLTAEHDYLGQLYETFFRYTGGNTIGQYFTPRHIAQLMADLCEIGRNDVVLDPACGSGGFLVATMDRLLRVHELSRGEMVKVVKRQLWGFETEPVTAALCVANMILRGDGSTQVHQEDCFTAEDYPVGKADVVLMNPPFPHKKTDTPSEGFVDRALDGLHNRGRLAVILPTSLIVKKSKGAWRKKILSNNRLVAVCQLPDELFQPYASATTSIVVLEKGVRHDSKKSPMFVRLHHDGLTLRKGIRVERENEPNHVNKALDAILNYKNIPGFSGSGRVAGEGEWAAGAFVKSAPPSEDEVRNAVDVHLRRLASFYIRYSKEVANQRSQIAAGVIGISDYRKQVSKAKLENALAVSQGAGPNTIGAMFDIFYGMKELHSREGIAHGDTLVISPTEAYNGCYGWLEFSRTLKPPFVTVAQTGSIGEAFVQFEPCAVNDDCLVLVPKMKGMSEANLVIAAACLHEEKWRFSYGRKLTPARIAEFVLPNDRELEEWVAEQITQTKRVVKAALEGYDPAIIDAFYI